MENQNLTNSEISKWWVLISGILFTVMGMYVFNNPALAVLSITYYIGFTKVASGILAIGFYFRNKAEAQGKMLLPIGIIDLLFGIFLLVSPLFKLTLIVMAPYYFGTWAIVRGLVLAFSSFSNKRSISNWLYQVIMGIIYVIVGVIFFVNPFQSFVMALGIVGMMLIIMGISTLIQFILLLFKK